MHLRKLMLRAVRKMMIGARRARSRRERFRKGLNQIQELNGQFNELRQRWIKHNDKTARRRAAAKLKDMHLCIRKLARNNHQRELQVFLRKQQIPGWRRAMPGSSRRRG